MSGPLETKCVTAAAAPLWQTEFLTIIAAAVREHARIQFRRLAPCDREEAAAEAVAAALVSYLFLLGRGKNPAAFPGRMAHFAVLRVKSGRRVGTRLRRRDVLAGSLRRERRFTVQSLLQRDPPLTARTNTNVWHEAVLEDRRTNVPDQAAFRIDFPRWLASQSPRKRTIAEFLAAGNSTNDAARKFQRSPARISQLRKEFHDDWQRFHGEHAESSTAAIHPPDRDNRDNTNDVNEEQAGKEVVPCPCA